MHYRHPPFVHVTQIGEGRIAPSDLVWKPEGKRTLGRGRCRWEDSIKYIRSNSLTGCGLYCSGSEMGQGSGCCEDNNESSGVVKCR